MELVRSEFKKVIGLELYFLGVGRMSPPPCYFEIYTADFKAFDLHAIEGVTATHLRQRIAARIPWDQVVKLTETWPLH